MSFYQLPHPWNPGYAIPDYVMAEPPERGTFTTQWLPRGTIPALVPDYLAQPGKKLLGRKDAGLGSLGGSSLGSVQDWFESVFENDPDAVSSSTASTKPMTNADVVQTLQTMPGVPKPPPKRQGLSANQKIAVVAGVGVVAYMLLKKKR